MKKTLKVLLLGVGISILISPNIGQAQSRAVHFDGATRMVNPGTLVGPFLTKSFACNYAYKSVDSLPTVIIDVESDSNAVLTVAHTINLGPGEIRLNIFISNGIGTMTWQVTSLDPLPTGDNKWHIVTFTGDTETGQFQYSIDGKDNIPDPDLVHYEGYIPIPIKDTRWAIGSALGHRAAMPPRFFGRHYVGRLFGTYHGDLAELMCRFGNDTYERSTTPGRSGWTQLEISQNGQRTAYGPVDMGEGCGAVYDEFPTICMRGDAGNFYRNQTDVQGSETAFVVDYGRLTTATTDPFELWRQ